MPNLRNEAGAQITPADRNLRPRFPNVERGGEKERFGVFTFVKVKILFQAFALIKYYCKLNIG